MSTKAGTERKQCVARNKGIARAADVLAREQKRLVAQGRAECTDHALAKAWGYKSHHTASVLFDGTSGIPAELGVLFSLPRELGIAVARGILGDLEAEGASAQTEVETLDRVANVLRRLTRRVLDDLADNGAIDADEEHAGNLREIEATARRGAEACERRARAKRGTL